MSISVCRKTPIKREPKWAFWNISEKKMAYSQKSGQEMRKKIQSKLTAKDSLDLIRGQPAKRRMRPV